MTKCLADVLSAVVFGRIQALRTIVRLHYTGGSMHDLTGFISESEFLANPADVLENLNENDQILTDAYNAWSTVQDTPARHVVKLITGLQTLG